MKKTKIILPLLILFVILFYKSPFAQDYDNKPSTVLVSMKSGTPGKNLLENLSNDIKKDPVILSDDDELKKGYEYIKQGDNKNAIIVFEKYKLKHPSEIKIYLQLGYLYSNIKDFEKALTNFEFVEENSKNTDEVDNVARSIYYTKELIISNSFKSMNIYFHNFYDTYYNNYISNFITHLNLKVTKNLYTGFYVDVFADSRSKTGTIYNDRYLEGGGFFKFKLTESVGLELRAGYVREIDFNKNSFNFKPILYAGTRIGNPLFYLGEKNKGTNYFYFDIYSTALYDYKFRNFFGQLQTKEVLRSMAGEFSYFEFYLSQSVLADSKQLDYNNLAEIGFGVNFKPNSAYFPVLFIETSNKTYFLGSSGKYFEGPLKNTFQFKAGFLINFNTKL